MTESVLSEDEKKFHTTMLAFVVEKFGDEFDFPECVNQHAIFFEKGLLSCAQTAIEITKKESRQTLFEKIRNNIKNIDLLFVDSFMKLKEKE